ncbi:hypothetical protein MHPYR_320045 [uncultured Mycobacterium sp.]|uniref:Uncharacterized protein n=1 Tax=uncultured Mycobacterium sp. TaxID=171292 RepID=A0A1Y5PCQ9_9MYCO|nr:hypothetical protein MHPYR_300033 [uncultured Mycobacterium sp.]SBS76467.1 hypothetical protein MHPYR_320045 [uncultured Mycobacterium sp.]
MRHALQGLPVDFYVTVDTPVGEALGLALIRFLTMELERLSRQNSKQLTKDLQWRPKSHHANSGLSRPLPARGSGGRSSSLVPRWMSVVSMPTVSAA